MKEIINKHWIVLLILGLSLLVVWPLFLPGYFSHQDDLQVIRIFEMGKCLTDLQIPCRWSPDLAYGYGYPLFNFYNPMPYYVGAIVEPVLGYLGSAKLLFFIPLFFSGFTMYIFASSVIDKKSSLLASVMYIFAPYRSVDTYVRGAIGESFALLLAPLIFYFSLKVVKEKKLLNFLGLSITLGLFLTSHNVSILIWSPIFAGWFLLVLRLEHWKRTIPLLVSTLLGFGISAFFTLPAFFEKNLVQVQNLTSGSLDFRNNFVSYKDLLTRSWGYGATGLGPNLGLSYQIGWPHWILVLIFVVVFIFLCIKKKIEVKKTYIPIFFILVFIFGVFMVHNKSTFIWITFDSLKFIQFPWRYLSVVIFAASILSGMLISFFKGKVANSLLIIIVLITVLLNWGYFRPEKFFLDITDSIKLSGTQWYEQVSGASQDYLPITAKSLKVFNDGLVRTETNTEITKLNIKSNSWFFVSNSPADVKVVIPVFYFPVWQASVNGKIIKTSYSKDGLITFSLPKGQSRVEGIFKNTPLRTVSNLVSLFSLVGLIMITIYAKNSKTFFS